MGEEDRRAQSRGLWPGVKSTFLRGLVGIEVCVGGGAREKEVVVGVRFGSWIGERIGGDMRPAVPWGLGVGRAPRRGGRLAPPEARWAEFGAGKEGGGARFEDARCAELREGKEGAGGEEERVKVGTVGVLSSSSLRGGEDCFGGSFLKGGGGGGMAFLSISALLIAGESSLELLGPSWGDIEGGASFFATSWSVGRWSQESRDHDEGGCR